MRSEIKLPVKKLDLLRQDKNLLSYRVRRLEPLRKAVLRRRIGGLDRLLNVALYWLIPFLSLAQ